MENNAFSKALHDRLYGKYLTSISEPVIDDIVNIAYEVYCDFTSNNDNANIDECFNFMGDYIKSNKGFLATLYNNVQKMFNNSYDDTSKAIEDISKIGSSPDTSEQDNKDADNKTKIALFNDKMFKFLIAQHPTISNGTTQIPASHLLTTIRYRSTYTFGVKYNDKVKGKYDDSYIEACIAYFYMHTIFTCDGYHYDSLIHAKLPLVSNDGSGIFDYDKYLEELYKNMVTYFGLKLIDINKQNTYINNISKLSYDNICSNTYKLAMSESEFLNGK